MLTGYAALRWVSARDCSSSTTAVLSADARFLRVSFRRSRYVGPSHRRQQYPHGSEVGDESLQFDGADEVLQYRHFATTDGEAIGSTRNVFAM
jgi:hypothetical protein